MMIAVVLTLVAICVITYVMCLMNVIVTVMSTPPSLLTLTRPRMRRGGDLVFIPIS
jgi:hypothetical protein